MSFEQIEREYKEIASEAEPYETLPKLISIVEKILKTLDKIEGGDDIKNRTKIILNNLRKEEKETFNREKVTTYLTIIKDILGLLKGLISEESEEKEAKKQEKEPEKTNYDALSDDINFIDRILEEEISEIEPVKTAPAELEKKEIKNLEMLIYELDNLKEYVRILSDKLFDIGEEILDIKERVSKLEKAFTEKPKKEVIVPPHVRVEEKTVEETKPLVGIPAEFEKIKKLIDEANRELGIMDENILKRAIKLESYKIQLEQNRDKIISAPENLRSEFERTYSKLIEQTNIIRRRLYEKQLV